MKFWWKGEPIITGSLRWRIIKNDLLNAIRQCAEALRKLDRDATIKDMADVAHQHGCKLEIKLQPK